MCLLLPRWSDPQEPGPQGLPFRSFTLGGAFLAAGWELVFFDQEHDLDRTDCFAELERELRGCTAAFVWMNEMYPFQQSTNAHRLATRLKSTHPELPLVLGGEFVTICPPELFDFDHPFDFVLRGYGEISGIRLLDRLRDGQSTDDVPGLVWRDAGGVLRHRPADRTTPLSADWLALYHRLDLSRYVQQGGVFGNDQPTLSLATGRGCTKGCAFCAWSNHPCKILRAREAYELIASMRDRYGVRQFHFGELDFFMSRKRALELADRLAANRPDCVWFALGSPVDLRRFTDADWARLHEGGLRKVEMGSESGSLRLLRAVGKRHEPEDIYRLSATMLGHGIVPMNNFLFGFPGETRADRAATLQLIERIWRLSPDLNHMTFRYYQPVWGTPLGDVALAHDVDRPRRLDAWLQTRADYPEDGKRTMPWLSEADEQEVKLLVNHHLPLVTSKLVLRSPLRRTVYRALRARALKGLRAARLGSDVERWVYRRVIASRLDRTFVA